MLLQEFKKGLLVLVPAEPVLGMADLKALKVQLSKKAQRSKAARLAEDQRRPVSFIAAALDQSAPAKEGEAGPGKIAGVPQGGKALNSEIPSKIELYVLPPEVCLALLVADVRRIQNARCGVSENFMAKLQFQKSLSDEHAVNVREMIFNFRNCLFDRDMVQILQHNLGEVLLGGGRCVGDSKLFELVVDDPANVEAHRALHVFAQGFGADVPSR
jgi:hypothetical protein